MHVKKGERIPYGIIARKYLSDRVCKKWKESNTVLVFGDCFYKHGHNYLYCGRVGKFFKQFLLYDSKTNDFRIVKRTFLNKDNFVIREFFPDYAKKCRKQWEEKRREKA